MAAPAEIGKYRILRELGRGAMGAVYLAEDPFIARRVAIKVMRPQVEEGEERFLQEARTVGSLSHPNIVLLHDFGFAGELPYLVMEHVEGTILDRWLSEPHGAEARLRIVLRGLDQLPERELRAKLTETKQLLDDRSLPGNLRGKLTDLAAKLRNDPGWRFEELRTGHNAMVTAPHALARALLLTSAPAPETAP